MNSDSGKSVSSWMATAAEVPGEQISGGHMADVCIVGAGIAGLTTAYQLTRERKSVVVLDDGAAGGGETGRTSAHLVTALDERYRDLERHHGAEGARLAARSHAAAIDRIESICADEKIDCGFQRVDGFLFAHDAAAKDVLERELDAAHRAGLGDVAWAERAPLESVDTGRCLRFPRQAQFHPLRYLAALAAAIRARNGHIYSGAHVTEVKGGVGAQVRTDKGATVRARSIVVATNSPMNDRVFLQTKQYAYRTYVIAARVPAGAVSRALYWDTADPFHYVRLQPLEGGREELLLVGGEDHRTGQTDDGAARWQALEVWMRKHFPAGAVEHRWSGQVLQSADGLGFIGRNPGGDDNDNVFVVTGDSGNGLTHGTIAGMLIPDLIAGRSSPWTTLYEPSRKMVRAAGRYAAGVAKSTGPYAEWLTPGDVKSAAEIRPGQGAVLREGLTKIAVFRDASGRLTRLSAVCPHLGGIVEWNSAEKTWDCPCHGSRFAKDGHVVNGPASTGLGPAE